MESSCPGTPGTDRSLPENLDEGSRLDSPVGEDEATSPHLPTEISGGMIEVGTGSIPSQQVATALFEARLQQSVVMQHVMPWETGVFGEIFGAGYNIFPRVQTPDLPTVSEVRHDDLFSEPVPFEQRTVSVHVRAVNFGSFKTKRYGEQYQRTLLCQRWEAILLHAPSASTSGTYLASFGDRTVRLEKIDVIFGGKAISTLRKRASQVKDYLSWGLSCGKGSMFPLCVQDLREYFDHLRDRGAARTVFTDWLPCAAFLSHVLGVQVEDGYFSDPVVRGRLRGLQLDREPRKQLAEVVILEEFLADESRDLRDRYGVGVILFAIFARARFGDLRRLQGVLKDFSDHDVKKTEVGYLEARSTSHKMRSVGNRIGLPLPMVAPLKGFSRHLWGKVFCDVAESLGAPLNLTRDRPMWRAPNLDGIFSERYVSARETSKWIKIILSEKGRADLESLTPHGAKATLLSMAAKFGLGEADRCVLGYHAYRRSSAAIYSRDLHAAPLRRLERVIACVRNGSFFPDASRSGMIDRAAAASTSLKKADQNKGIAFGVLEGDQHPGDLIDSPLDSDLERIVDEAIHPEERDRMESSLTAEDDPWLKPESQRFEPFHESLRIEIAENPLQQDFDRDSEEERAYDKKVDKVPPTDDIKDDFGDAETSD